MPPFAASPTIASAARRFAEAAAASLSARPRQLASEFLYDALGSALFEAISQLPWYPITRAETALLRAHASEITEHMASLTTLVELGPGSGGKLAALLRALEPTQALDVHLVDVSGAALDAAARTLDTVAGLRVVTHRSPYGEGVARAVRERAAQGSVLTLFLGSNIGNFDRAGAEAFLVKLRGLHRPGDCLLLGVDLTRPEAETLLAYDDPLGVTAAFNLNVLVRANRELGADFSIEKFSHRAVWNVPEARVEMHLVSLARQRVSIPAAGLDLVFDAGETIWTESSYKYEPEGICTLLANAGFETIHQWVEDRFALTLAEVV